MKTIIVIPARLQSSRLSEKLLLKLDNKTIIQHVYERCLLVNGISGVFIAVDDQKLLEHCRKFSQNVILTSKEHQSGTDRIAEAIENLDCEAVINVQGDEPFIDSNLIANIAIALKKNAMVSAMTPIVSLEEIENPNNVKVITNKNSEAIYFSRSIIPYNRDGVNLEEINYFKHLGIYGYSKKFLLEYALMKQTSLEKIEKLEQLRVLENGYSIYMIKTDHNAIGIDTIEDYEQAKKMIKKNDF